MKAHQKTIGDEDEWLTPPSIWGPLGPFDLDPCASNVRPWQIAAQCFTAADDGLNRAWRGRVWCNPPFNRYQRPHWMRKMADHGSGLLLIPGATETDAFYKYVWEHPNAKAVCFLRGRPHFYYTDGTVAKFNSGTAIVLVGYSDYDAKRLIAAHLGKTLLLSGSQPH